MIVSRKIMIYLQLPVKVTKAANMKVPYSPQRMTKIENNNQTIEFSIIL